MTHNLTLATLSGQSSPEPRLKVSPRHLIGLSLGAWECRIGVDRKSLDFLTYKPGDLFVSRKNVEEWICWKASGEVLLAGVSDAVLDEVAHEIHHASVPTIEPAKRFDDPRMRSLMYALHSEQKSGFAAGKLLLEALSCALATLLLTSRGGLRSAQIFRAGLAPRQLRRVLEYIEANLERDLTLRDLAQLNSLSVPHFAQMFRLSTGEPPHRFVLKRRIEQAKKLLLQSNERVLDVALKTGFRSQQHFARVFRSVCSMTPSAFRRL